MVASSFSRRPGLSLTEVLVAIFVMAIGMLSLLVLFPVGLSNMRWALQDNRLALASATALANAEAMQLDPISNRPVNLRSEPNYVVAARWIEDSLGNGLFRWYPPAAGGFPVAGTPDPTTPVATYDLNGPRPPIFIDSVGALAFPNLASGLNNDPTRGTDRNFGYGIGARKSCLNTHDRVSQPLMGTMQRPFLFGLPRVRSSHITGINDAMRACVQDDEIAFGQNAQPTMTAGMLDRENRYSWAYMCRFPKGTDPSVVDMTIVLYNARRTVPGSALDRTSGERRYFGNPNTTNNGFLAAGLTPATGLVFIKGSSEAVIDLYDPNANWAGFGLPASAAVASPFKKGDVILDNTLVMPNFHSYNATSRYYAPFATQFTLTATAVVPPDPATGVSPGTIINSGLANGFFYKIVHVGPVEQVTAGAGAGRFIQRLMLDRPALADGFEAVYLDGAIDIIEKSNGRTPSR